MTGSGGISFSFSLRSELCFLQQLRLALKRTRTRLCCLLPTSPICCAVRAASASLYRAAMAGLPIPVPAFHRRGLDLENRCLRKFQELKALHRANPACG